MIRLIGLLITVLIVTCVCMIAVALEMGRVAALADNEMLFINDLRAGNNDIYRFDIAHQLMVPITRSEAVESEPNWSPDGEQIAFDSNREGQYTIYVMDAQGGDIHRLSDDTSYAYGPSWSPDGHFMAYITTQFPISPELMLLDMRSGQTRRLTDNREIENSPTWSPDGRHLAISYNTSKPRFMNIFNLDLQTGDMNPFFITPDNKRSLNWSADGRSLLYITWGGNPGIYMWNIDHAKSTLVYPFKGLNIRNPNWSPDGRFIVYAPLTSNNNNRIFTLDVAVCLQAPESCTPEPLPLPPAGYSDPRWRPNLR